MCDYVEGERVDGDRKTAIRFRLFSVQDKQDPRAQSGHINVSLFDSHTTLSSSAMLFYLPNKTVKLGTLPPLDPRGLTEGVLQYDGFITYYRFVARPSNGLMR